MAFWRPFWPVWQACPRPHPAHSPRQDEEGADVRPAERIEPAPVVPATELESATVPATEIEDAPVVAPTELEDAPVVPLTEVEEMVVTGSRLARTPGELAGNLVILDEDFINATGGVTLERVLRQLPQNLNSTTEQVFSNLNNVPNFNGASTVNLRGLGAESTLILIDGKRAGHNGFLGGVTDVSSIPLSIVERVEVMLDGASAIYGSDAVSLRRRGEHHHPQGLPGRRGRSELQHAERPRIQRMARNDLGRAATWTDPVSGRRIPAPCTPVSTARTGKPPCSNAPTSRGRSTTFGSAASRGQSMSRSCIALAATS